MNYAEVRQHDMMRDGLGSAVGDLQMSHTPVQLSLAKVCRHLSVTELSGTGNGGAYAKNLGCQFFWSSHGFARYNGIRHSITSIVSYY